MGIATPPARRMPIPPVPRSSVTTRSTQAVLVLVMFSAAALDPFLSWTTALL